MGIVSWIVLGLLAGVIAKWIMPGKDNMGWILTILLGIGGALLGGYGGTYFGVGGLTGFSVKSLGLAVGGSLILLIIYRIAQR